MQPYLYAIGIGSNRRHGQYGAPAEVVKAAAAALDKGPTALKLLSPVIATPAMGPAGRGFANAAVIIETRLEPPELLVRLKAMESTFGRRRGRRWGARVLDLDILLWSGGEWPSRNRSGLAVPHRGLEHRDFVLRPLLAIAGQWRLGRQARTVRHAHHRLLHGRVDPGSRSQ